MTEDASSRILLVDDEPEITSALARGLALSGYGAVETHRMADALARLEAENFAAAIVDVMIGADSGIELVATIRERGHRLPVLMLSALSDVEDRAAGLEAGADDYIVKPFSFDELVARLRVQERRVSAARPGPALYAPGPRSLTRGGEIATLTEREADLMMLFVERPGAVISRGEIFDALWAEEGSSSENVVDVYLGYLRRKLGADERFGFEIKTLRGKGFVLEGMPPQLEGRG